MNRTKGLKFPGKKLEKRSDAYVLPVCVIKEIL
jgi:hypothetical protein